MISLDNYVLQWGQTNDHRGNIILAHKTFLPINGGDRIYGAVVNMATDIRVPLQTGNVLIS